MVAPMYQDCTAEDMQRVGGNVGARTGGARCRRGHYQVMYPRLSVDGTRVPNAAAMTPIRDILLRAPYKHALLCKPTDYSFSTQNPKHTIIRGVQ